MPKPFCFIFASYKLSERSVVIDFVRCYIINYLIITANLVIVPEGQIKRLSIFPEFITKEDVAVIIIIFDILIINLDMQLIVYKADICYGYAVNRRKNTFMHRNQALCISQIIKIQIYSATSSEPFRCKCIFYVNSIT